MRLFQNSGVPPSLSSRCLQQSGGATTFKAQIARFLDNRYGALHFLAPVLNGDDTAFFTNGDDEVLQRTWAREMGMSRRAALADILLAQIESHRTEVFYNLDPVRYGSDFIRKLPGCVRKAVAWRNIPSFKSDFSQYDLIVCNSGTLLRSYEERGWKAAYFSPAHDPVMDEYASNGDRPIDFLFVGGYSRHHMRRAAVLEAVARLRDRYRIEFCLARSRFTQLAESAMGYLAPLGRYRRPKDIRAISREPVYGRDLYAMIAKAKIVLNGAIDMSGEDRGNMRCFEAMGCRGLLLSDEGVYPEGMVAGKTLVTYQSPTDVLVKLNELLQAPQLMAGIANAGYEMIARKYSKEQQWSAFSSLISNA
jgi:glycosyltransferase involved in cell wall biosynthesis